jgi:hypothetical protein
MAIDLKALVKDKRLWVVAGVGGGAGLLVLLRNRSAGGGAAAAGDQAAGEVTGTIPGAAGQFPGSPGIDAYNAVQDVGASLADQLGGQYQDILDALSQLPGTAPPNPSSPPGSAPKTGSIVGSHGTKVTSSMSLRDFARRYAGAPNNPTSVEATLRWIIANNQWLTGTPQGKAIIGSRRAPLKPGQILVVPTRAK